jgi:hypothetical protein
LRFELLRGHLTPEQHAAELRKVRDTLSAQSEPHWREFLSAWPDAPA